MAIETLEDIAEEMADKLGIYGACAEYDCEHREGGCRPHFTVGLVERMREAARIEQVLTGGRDHG